MARIFIILHFSFNRNLEKFNMSRGFTPRGRGGFSPANRGRGGHFSYLHRVLSDRIVWWIPRWTRWWRWWRWWWWELLNRTSRSSFRYLVSHEKCSNVAEMGSFMHACEGDMLYESTNTKIPYFNAPIYLENKVSVACFSSN